MKLNEKIKQARINAGLTQKQLAGKIGTPTQNYAMYEYGTRRPRFERLKKIAKVCGVGLDYFGDIKNLQKETGVDTADKKTYFRLYMQRRRKKSKNL